ncbi:MAG: glycosyltransferase family 4 protein, partial [Oscillospiraceae bacterium]
MKFIFFCAQYLPTVGGVERYTHSLAARLVKNGHCAVVVTGALEGLSSCETDELGIKIYRLPVVWLMNHRFPVIKPTREFFRLKKEIENERADFGVIQTRFYLTSLFGAGFCTQNKIPSIVIDHSTSHLLSGGLVGCVGQWYEHLAAGYLKKQVGGFYGVSKRCTQWLTHFGIDAKGVLYNCIDLEGIEGVPPATKREYDISPQALVVVFAARLVKEKGVLKLLEAFESLGYPPDKGVLMIAGDGELFSAVKAREKDNIRVLGGISFEKAIGLYKMADIFCLPTDYPEGLPTTVLEAAAAKTMVIATDRGGTGEVIRDDSYGIILKENTPE